MGGPWIRPDGLANAKLADAYENAKGVTGNQKEMLLYRDTCLAGEPKPLLDEVEIFLLGNWHNHEI